MEQNINLLTTLNIQPTSFLNSVLIVQATSGWIILLILLYSISSVLHSNKQKSLVYLEATKKSIQMQVDALNLELTAFSQTNIQQGLTNLPFSSTNFIGFYRYLEDLATFTPKNIWLDNIIFSQPDDFIMLKGNATTAAEIPIFIDALNQSDDFNDKKFSTLQLQKNPDSNSIGFALGTIAATETESNKTK
ncbi:MAG: hypothetical protein ACD_21C00072G0024 [uncultured bacterium]|nr:MAG: hypothetical protein ACD_21C00072G0024 [uncultured bacterium]